MTDVYELWEADYIGRKLLNKVDEKNNIVNARKRAIELAKEWCVEEEPSIWGFAKGVEEFWAGEADFGIAIVKKMV